MKSYKLNQRGIASLNFVILMLVAALFVTGGISLIQKTMVLNEIQGTMDKAGIVALMSSIDDSKFRETERLEINKANARTQFRNTLSDTLTTSETGLLRNYEIRSVNIYENKKDQAGSSIGISGAKVDQYFLEAVVVARFRSNPVVDMIMMESISFFDFFRTNSQETQIVQGTTGDGEMEIIIRSVTRVVLR